MVFFVRDDLHPRGMFKPVVLSDGVEVCCAPSGGVGLGVTGVGGDWCGCACRA